MVCGAADRARRLGPPDAKVYPAAILHPLALAAHAAIDAGAAPVGQMAQGLAQRVKRFDQFVIMVDHSIGAQFLRRLAQKAECDRNAWNTCRS